MGTYKIAPDSTGPIGMAQMKYGLVNKTNYNHSNGTTNPVSMITLVASPTTYQGDLTSKTWNSVTPYGFAEMYGQTWQDLATYTYTFTESIGACSKYQVSMKVNGTTANVINNLLTPQNEWAQDSGVVTQGDSIQIIAYTVGGSAGPGCANVDTSVTVTANGTTVIGPIDSNDGTITYSFTASQNLSINVSTTALY